MRRLLDLARLVDRGNRAVGTGVMWGTLAMVLIGAFNALARQWDHTHGTAFSSNAWLEAQWYLFSLAFLFGAPWALQAGAHVRVDVLHDRFGPRLKAWVDLLGTLLLLLPFCVFALVESRDFVADSVRVREVSNDPGGLVRWPLKLAVPVAFGLLLLQAGSEVVKRLAYLRGLGGEELLGLAERPASGADLAEASGSASGSSSASSSREARG